jgi:hypothetical protein
LNAPFRIFGKIIKWVLDYGGVMGNFEKTGFNFLLNFKPEQRFLKITPKQSSLKNKFRNAETNPEINTKTSDKIQLATCHRGFLMRALTPKSINK